MRQPSLSLLPILTLLGAGLSQEPGPSQKQQADASLRVRVSGEVFDLQQKPWAGAMVRLVSQPLPSVDESGLIDMVEVKTDERGRFRVAVLRHRSYSAWAGQKLADGAWRFTSIAEQVAPGSRARLVESKRRAKPIEMKFTALDRWQEFAPFRVRALSDAKNQQRIPVTIDDEKRGTIPPLPGESCTVEVFGRGGAFLGSARVIFAPWRQGGEFPLGPPRDFYIEVRDAATGKGIANATVYHALRGSFHPIGKTGQDGVATIRRRTMPRRDQTFVLAKGYTIGLLRPRGPNLKDQNGWKPLREKVRIASHTILNKGARYTGQIRIAGRPAKNATLILRGQSSFIEQGHAHYIQPFQRVIKTDGEGRFVLEGCSTKEDLGTTLDLVLSTNEVLRLPKGWHRQIRHRVNDVVDLGLRGKETGKAKVTLAPIDVARFCPVMLEVAEPTGMPSQDVRVAVGRHLAMNNHDALEGSYLTDRVGRVCFLARPGDASAIVLLKGSMFTARQLEVRSAVDDHSIAFVRHKFREPWEISGAVLSKKGRPLAGVRIGCYMNWDRSLDPSKDASPKVARKPTGNNAVLGDLPPITFTNCVSTFIGYSLSAKTDKLGKFKILVPAISMKWQLAGHRTSFLFITQRVSRLVELEDGSVTGLKLTL